MFGRFTDKICGGASNLQFAALSRGHRQPLGNRHARAGDFEHSDVFQRRRMSGLLDRSSGSGPQGAGVSHILIDVKDVPQVIRLLDLTVGSASSPKRAPSIVIATDMKEKRQLTEAASPKYSLDALKESGYLGFVFKPLKASKFAAIFDPKGQESSAETDQTSAQAVATVQRNAFNNLQSKYGDKGLFVLLLEDNRVNQQVRLAFRCLPFSLTFHRSSLDI